MMSKNRIIFFVFFGIYHLITFIFTYYVDTQQDNVGMLSGIYKFIYLFKYGTFVGLTLFVVDFVWSWRAVWKLLKDKEDLQMEVNEVKAKLYDLTEGTKKSHTDFDNGIEMELNNESTENN